MEKAVNSAITKLGTLLNLTPTNSLPTGKKKKAPVASANTSSTSGATIVSPSEETPVGSPPRRRKSTRTTVTESSSSAHSPRKGARSKRARHAPNNQTTSPTDASTSPSHVDERYDSFRLPDRPTTDFLGWRRLHIDEIIHLQKGDSVIIIIPSNTRTESKSITKLRDAFRSRVVKDIVASRKGCLPQIDSENRRKASLKMLEDISGIKRNNKRVWKDPTVGVTPYSDRERRQLREQDR
mmetsp:Transcript_16973/g.35887  ORF Transcript_16973/g.35887 Transcript_16973/m.35887 type:complete len:239 (-) Transcript_16973:607-1323(-)